MTKVPVLVDFDGVIRIGDKIAADAGFFFRFLESNKIPFFIISNSTQYTGNDIKKILKLSGIHVNVNAMTTIDATLQYLEKTGLKINVYCKGHIIEYFKSFISEGQPDAVVIGDLEEEWSYDILNEIFRKVHNGADIIAMQKNKFWIPPGKDLSLDAGAFINAIEYASSKEALLIGKPSRIYFDSALQALGYPNGTGFVMIGDDINTDIKGAKNMGGTGVLVFTGKAKKDFDRTGSIIPDYECNNLIEATIMIKNIFSQYPF